MSEALMQPKGAVIPSFFVDEVENTFKSKQEGRPVFDEIEFVKIIIPGDRNSQAVQKVDDEVKARWPKEYAAFAAGLEAPLEGTPLKEWPAIKRSQVLELAHFNIKTVEQLADLGDNHIQNLGMGARELRAAAKMFLEVARSGTGPLTRMVDENLKLRDENARLYATIAEQAAHIKVLEKAPNADV